MTRRIVILDSAKEEFRDIKAYVKRQFGDTVWSTVNAEYKHSFQLIKANPKIGHVIDGLSEFGTSNIRYTLVRQTRGVYEFDDSVVLIHMFISTKRDFRTHLFKRLLQQ